MLIRVDMTTIHFYKCHSPESSLCLTSPKSFVLVVVAVSYKPCASPRQNVRMLSWKNRFREAYPLYHKVFTFTIRTLEKSNLNSFDYKF